MLSKLFLLMLTEGNISFKIWNYCLKSSVLNTMNVSLMSQKIPESVMKYSIYC